MKSKLQTALAKAAPSISIQTLWDHDPDLCDIRQDCDGMDDENPDDWQAWQSQIRVTVIQNGEEITGNAYLGGTWEKAGDDPAESNPEISGYEWDMTQEALLECQKQLDSNFDDFEYLTGQIEAALESSRVFAQGVNLDSLAKVDALAQQWGEGSTK